MKREVRVGGGRTLIGVVGAASLLLGSAMAAETNPPTFEEIARGYGLTEKDVKEIRGGKRAGGDLEAASDNELSLAFGIPVSKDVAWLRERLIAGKTADHTVMASQAIESPDAAAFAELSLPPSEIKWLAEVEAGEDANFSTEEIERLQASAALAKGPARDAALLKTFHEILAGRVAAYQRGGLEGVVPYDRGKGDFGDPAGHLTNALAELKITKRVAPAVYEAIASFPTPPAEGVTSTLYWVVHDANDRVIVALGHRAYGEHDGRLVALDRRFYVSHTLNSMQTVAVAVPVESGSVVFYANRTATDLVTGFASGIAKKIGRTLMRSEIGRIADEFEHQTGDR